MVNHIPDAPVLDVLADPTRRAVVAMLAARPHPAGELAAACAISRPALSRHLRLLRSRDVVEEYRIPQDGRVRMYRLRREPLDDVGHRAASQEGGASEMADAITAVRHSVEVPADPETAFRLYTAEINRWWKRGTHYWNARHRAVGLRFEPFVGGRFIEVYDAQTGEGFEIGRVQVWEPGRRLVYTWREAGWAPGAQTEVEVLFDPTAQGTRVTEEHL